VFKNRLKANNDSTISSYSHALLKQPICFVFCALKDYGAISLQSKKCFMLRRVKEKKLLIAPSIFITTPCVYRGVMCISMSDIIHLRGCRLCSGAVEILNKFIMIEKRH
jgi:hypothetical protein